MADQRSVFVPFDLDTGGGTEQVLGITPRGAASGGSLPIFTDPVALADNTSNPTVGGAAVFGHVFDGANWDRLPGTSADGVTVNLAGNNDVTVTSGNIVADTELPAAVALSVDNVASPTAPAVGAFPHWFDGATWDRALGDSTDGLLVNLGTNNDVSVTGSVDTELPAAVLLSDSLAVPTAPAVGSYLLGYDRVNDDFTRIAGLVDGEVVGALNAGFLQFGTDGSNYQAIAVDAAGQLQVDVLSGGGSPAPPTTPVNDTFTSVAVAVATPTNIDTAELTTARKLAWIDIWSSVNWKGEVLTIDDGTPSTRKGVTGGPAMFAVQYIPVHEDFIQTAVNAGLDAFRLTFTNLDDNLPADAHVVFHYND